MKWIFGLLFLLSVLFSGCGLRERETSVQKKETELAQKEQELNAKEKELRLKEEELIKRAQWLDSTAQDTTVMFNPQLLGQWNARMTCTETTCSGSAVGDTKTETWELTFQNDHIIARAMTGENMVRVYTGTYKNNLLELTENVELSPSTPATKILVRLTLVNENTLDGLREIIRTGDCKITYALQLTK
ncbi:MAG: hypothetical protein COW65_14525 [Cytophagales bacterium CG18_big_fil_WC_8_21_14_2_50_42_9]|nr:MAG: hypothetical protein COW65_14525 [Cytophagales bacterium CG18_big_fil_WC_8_21_14_2_50_42_9]